MDDEMKAARAAWWSVVNWDHLDELTACEAWDAAERVHRAIVADIPGEAKRDALREQLDNELARGIHTCHEKCQRVECVLRRERDTLRARLVALEDEKNTYIDYVGDALGQGEDETLWDAAQRVLSERDRLRGTLEEAMNLMIQHDFGTLRTVPKMRAALKGEP